MERRRSIPAERDGERYRTGAPAGDGDRRRASGRRAEDRRRETMYRWTALAAFAFLAFVAGIVAGAADEGSAAAARFAAAWERQDFEAMHAELTPAAREEHPLDEFTRDYVEAQATATAVRVLTGETDPTDAEGGDAEEFQATVDTRAFGQVSGRVELPVDEEGRVEWSPHLTFPGLTEGEQLRRETTVAERAPILAADGTPLAEGPAASRTSPLGNAALAISGSVGSPSRKQDAENYALGFPEGTPAGLNGLELLFNSVLAGQPSGQLIAAGAEKGGEERILASGDPLPGKPVRTTIDPEVQKATVDALGDQYGGVAVLDARNGSVAGVAGIAFSAPQPPGSTFKVITATAALAEDVVEMDDEFPVESSNDIIGREISNAGDAPCGGSFVESFADSCNTVFAPLGVEVGRGALVDTAEKFGFGEPPALAAEEALAVLEPPASTMGEIDGDVALGEAAIGQGQVLATPLQMASVAQAVANDGVRSPTSIARTRGLRPDADPVEVASPEVAAQVQQLMLAVVEAGTGTAAQVSGIDVAGKTGTAELGPAPLAPGQVLAPGEDAPQTENAWFTAYAPAAKPRYAIGVMLIDVTGGGGGVAAPIAQDIFESILG